MTNKKIAIVGICCSGKSTLSRRLAVVTELPVFHMDSFFWKANWEKIPEKDYLLRHHEIVEEDEWIIEGYIDKRMSERAQKADLIIDLDFSGLRCLLRSIRRLLMYQNKSRPELAEGCYDNYSLRSFWTIFTRGERKVIEEAIEGVDKSHIRKIYTQNELEKYLELMK